MSSRHSNYFDNAATTPIDPIVFEAMLPYLQDNFGNANSIHSWGRQAREAVEKARSQVAKLIGCLPYEITFTSGATESNNWVLQDYHSVAVSPFEHASIKTQAHSLGFQTLENSGFELLSPTEDCELISVMTINNETGAILELPVLSSSSTKIHRDATQSVGKFELDLDSIDFASMSSHKMYGPKGVGALYRKGAEPLEPLLYGGEQEFGARAGTLYVPGIVGFGAACHLATESMESNRAHAESLREIVIDELAELADWQHNTHSGQSPFVLNLSIAGIEGESLVVELDSMGFAISAGSACHSESSQVSWVLKSLEVSPDRIRGSIRVSFSKWNTKESAQDLARHLKIAISNLRSLGT